MIWLRGAVIALSVLLVAPGGAVAQDFGAGLQALFQQQVDRRLDLPEDARQDYARLLKQALADYGIAELTPQLVVLVDRNPNVQALMLFWKPPGADFRFIGASPASTGKPGRYEYFESPLGVFRHSPASSDFRAEGTRNGNGILGYGPKGSRVYDFGWQLGRRGWGDGGVSLMRLQLHSTDPDMLEPRVGSAQSKGCIRIPLSLNRFLDHYGVLDADYDRWQAEGKTFWVLAADREPTAWAGRYLVIVDSRRTERPAWSPAPRAPASSRSLPGKE